LSLFSNALSKFKIYQLIFQTAVSRSCVGYCPDSTLSQ